MDLLIKSAMRITVVSLMVFAPLVFAEDLRILGEDKLFVTTLPSGESITITRQMTPQNLA